MVIHAWLDMVQVFAQATVGFNPRGAVMTNKRHKWLLYTVITNVD